MNTDRMEKQEWYLAMAELVSRRATCIRRAVGCVLVDGLGHVLSTGYNGVARGLPHCNERVDKNFVNLCAGATAPSGTSLEACEAVHAEMNALLQCRDVERIAVAYVTVSPCITCVKLLMNTSCQEIVFRQPYAEPHLSASKRLWERGGRIWTSAPEFPPDFP